MTVSRRVLLNGAAIAAPGLSRLSSRMGQQWLTNNTPTVVQGSFTLLNIMTLESDFEWVRLVFENPIASPYSIDAIAVAPLSALGIDTAPVAGAVWTQGYFNDGGAATSFPPSAAGSTSSITVPAGTGAAPNEIPARVYSDWIQVSALPRSDGGALPLLAVQTYMSGIANPVFFGAQAPNPSWLQIANRSFVSYRLFGVNGTLNPGSAWGSADPPPSNWSIPMYVYGQRGRTIRCRESVINRKRSSPSCVRSTC